MTIDQDQRVPSAMTPAEEQEALVLAMYFAMGWNDEDKFTWINTHVEALGPHAISQAFKIITEISDAGLPSATILQNATMSFLREGNTDELAFLGVERGSHRTLTQTVREMWDGQRYAYSDFLQAPSEVLYEARAIVGIGDLCLSGLLRNGTDCANEVHGGWGLTDRTVIELIQRYPFKGDEIIRIMTEQESCNPERVEYAMNITAPLLDGVL